MDPITLHLNIFKAGANAEGKQSLRVSDPGGTTIGSLKRQLFAEALEEQRSVRFIRGGHVLEDAAVLQQCGLGSEAFIHVSIGNSAPRQTEVASVVQGSTAGAGNGSPAAADSSSRKGPEDCFLDPYFVVGALFLAGTGVLLQMAWRKRWYLPMHVSQLLCILAAVWVYLLLCHGLPAFFQLLARGLRALNRGDGNDPPAVGSGSAGSTTAPSAAECAGRHETARSPPLAGVTTPGGSGPCS
uniref:Ubiquitin-like domain-containing protein n=1 Tax=Alexandrium catenella TaxID=2925 RepID=A0A7S1MC39_ALECA|mmetsp:Transcript_23951/g.65270  ORF Transcript_23951/g.65270 Transcript_23951/m.65270 type:complete len:242 (+) Transcript_23951:40-765(+)